MFKINGKYGNVHISGKSIDIEESNIEDLKKHLNQLEQNRTKLIEQQNNYLSQIIG